MEDMSWVGLVAAFCTTAAFVPQVVAIIRSGSVDGISLGTYVLFTLGLSMWLAYGLIIGDLPIILANLISVVLAITVLWLTVKQRLSLRENND